MYTTTLLTGTEMIMSECCKVETRKCFCNSKSYQMLGIIKRNFIHLTPDSFVILYKALVRSHLEHAVCVCVFLLFLFYYQFLIEKLEKVQKRLQS